MTAVLCSVCTHRITTEADRIYCFGGCEQIYHSKCCDMPAASVTAMKTNVSLKYFCFECRKIQSSLNDVLTKCAELIQRVGSVEASVREVESTLNSCMKEQFAALESRLLSVFQKSPCNTDHVGTEKAQSYADVAGKTVQPVAARQAETASAESCPKDPEAGSLRSGRIRITDTSKPSTSKASETASNSTTTTKTTNTTIPTNTASLTNPTITTNLTNPTNLTNLTNMTNGNADTRNPGTPKPKQAMKFEQTVVFKPKQTQSVDVTKQDVRSKFNPISYAVKDVRYRDNGEVVVRCESDELANEMVRVARESLSDKYEIDTQKPLRPRVKIVGITEEPENIVDTLRKQNRLPESAELTVIRKQTISNTTGKSLTVLLETNAVAFELLTKTRVVNIGWERCRLFEVIDAMRCFKCSQFGHKSSSCRNAFCCPKCAGEHNVRDCPSEAEVCINCKEKNRHRKPNEAALDESHAAWSANCPLHKIRLKMAKKRIDYSI